MQIKVKFLNGSSYWQNLVTGNAAKSSVTLSSPDFISWVRSHRPFDDTVLTPDQIADLILNTLQTTITVGFYWNPFGLAIAKESKGQVLFNTAKYRYGAGSPGNIAHETFHGLNFEHVGNSPVGQQNTVPWAIGNEVDARNR